MGSPVWSANHSTSWSKHSTNHNHRQTLQPKNLSQSSNGLRMVSWRQEYPGHSGQPQRWPMLVRWLVVWSLNYNPTTLFCNPPVLLCKRCPASTQQQLQHNTTSFWWEDGEYFCYCVSALKSAKCCLSEQNLPVADVREHVLKRKGENSESASEVGRVSCE